MHFVAENLRWTALDNFTKAEREQALQIVCSTISRCEKAWPKFKEGTSQHTLLKNRIKALYISNSLITETGTDNYSKEELADALRPVCSIISKCEKVQMKYTEGTSQHTRFKSIIQAMDIAKSLIEAEIGKRG